jgi:hypothetical protein
MLLLRRTHFVPKWLRNRAVSGRGGPTHLLGVPLSPLALRPSGVSEWEMTYPLLKFEPEVNLKSRNTQLYSIKR